MVSCTSQAIACFQVLEKLIFRVPGNEASQARKSTTEINTTNTSKLPLFEVSNNSSISSLESPTLEYVEMLVTATTGKRRQSGGEEQGINHYVV